MDIGAGNTGWGEGEGKDGRRRRKRRLAPHKAADATIREGFDDGGDDEDDGRDDKDAGTEVHSSEENDRSMSDVMQRGLLLLLLLLLLTQPSVSIT